MEALSSNIPVVGAVAALVLSGLVLAVLKMSSGPNYEELFRKQREQLLAMDESKQPRKKDKPGKKKEKRDKKEGSSTPVEQHRHSDHVDFSEKRDIKVVELDEPPMVEPEKVLSRHVQPAKPILVHADTEIPRESLEAARPNIIRSNSFREIKPKDEVELHKKTQQSPGKATKTAAPTAKVAPMAISQQAEETAEITAAAASGESKSRDSSVAKIKDEAVKKTIAESPSKKVFSKKELRQLLHQIEHRELPSDVGEDIVQRLVDALLNHQNESKEWKSTRQDPMQQLRKNLQEKEECIQYLTSQLNSARTRSNELYNESSQWKTKYGQIQAGVVQAESRLREELHRAVSEAQRSQEQLRGLQQCNEQLHSKVVTLEQTLTSLRRNEERIAAEKQTFSSKADKLRDEVGDLKAQLDKAHKCTAEAVEAEKRQWEIRLKQSEAEVTRVKQQLSETQKQADLAQKELSGCTAGGGQLQEENASLKEEVTQLKNRNNQLHQKNWATVEGMNQAEKKFMDLQRKIASDEEKRKTFMLDGLPAAVVGALRDLEGDDFLKGFVAQAKQQVKEIDRLKVEVTALQTRLESSREAFTESSSREEDADTATELNTLRDEVAKLRAENLNYSGVLNETETMLQNLQDSVEREEKRWAEDRSRFEAERSEMASAIRELEEKLKELQAQLEETEVERSSALSHLGESRAENERLSKQLAMAQQVTPQQVSQEAAHPQNGHQSTDDAASTTSGQQNGGHDGRGFKFWKKKKDKESADGKTPT